MGYQNLSSPVLQEGTYKVRAIADSGQFIGYVHNLILQNVHVNLLLFRLSTYRHTTETHSQHTTPASPGAWPLDPQHPAHNPTHIGCACEQGSGGWRCSG